MKPNFSKKNSLRSAQVNRMLDEAERVINKVGQTLSFEIWEMQLSINEMRSKNND